MPWPSCLRKLLLPNEPSGFYRYLQERTPVEEDMELRSVIQQIALEQRRRYGYRRVSAELRRRGMLANQKRVARIMREDNLLAVQPRHFVVTTDSNHELEVYLNLARRMKLSGIDQLWVDSLLQSLFRVSPRGNAPSCLGTFERHCKGGRLLNGFPILFVGVCHGSNEIRSVPSNVPSPRLPQCGIPICNSALLVICQQFNASA